MWIDLSDERIGLEFARTVASGPCKSNHSPVQVPQNSLPYFTVSFDTPQPGGSTPYIYIPQEQGGPVIPPGTGFPFRRLLRLARLRWRYSIPRLTVGCNDTLTSIVES
jgi:hypothetical protein